MVFIEVEGQPNDGVIGYSRVMWWQEDATKHRIYFSFGFLLPEWRRKGIGTAVLKYNQRRLMEIASDHPHDGERFFQSAATDSAVEMIRLLQKDGYVAVSHGAEMVRPDLEDIPDVVLPDGIEVRPVREEDMQALYEAEVEAFRDHWGFSEGTMQSLEEWKNEPGYDPSLWKVAWQGDQVVGMVRGFINPLENEKYHRKRGWTEHISVRRPWRRMGVARALINLSLQALKERGMEEAALGVHVENPNGAFALYESCGFRVVLMDTEYRKPMPE
jgi:ribosomal protein S18 acetylase RimI-like enzyme